MSKQEDPLKTQCEFKGFEYSISENNKYSVVDPGKGVPVALFKYYGLSENSVSGIENNTVFATPVHYFNDIFDLAKTLWDYRGVRLEDYNKIFDSKPIDKSEFESKKELYQKHLIDVIYKMSVGKFGVFCTTTNCIDDIFWGVYTNHKGFCVEYDSEKFGKNFQGPFPMNYIHEDEFTPIDFARIGGEISFLITSTMKKDFWKREDEYRFIVWPKKTKNFITDGVYDNSNNPYERESRVVDIDKKVVKSLTFGFRFLGKEDIVSKTTKGTIVQFSSKEGVLKSRLFKYLIDRSIDAFGVIYEESSHKIVLNRWKITHYEKERFHIEGELI